MLYYMILDHIYIYIYIERERSMSSLAAKTVPTKIR